MSDDKDIITGFADDKKLRSLDHTTNHSDDENIRQHGLVVVASSQTSNAPTDSKDRDRHEGDGYDKKTDASRGHVSKSRKDQHHSRHRSESKRDRKKSSKKSRRRESHNHYSDGDDNSYTSSSSDESSSDSDDDDNRRRRRRHDKEKKRKHESKKHRKDDDRLKDRKSKKKKHKKDRRDSDRAASEHSTSAAAPTFGQHGIIKSSDMSKMQRSFEIWLSEIHGVHMSSSNIPRYELQQYFDTYREDYNTATLPHIKYYNYDKWELEEHEKQKRELEQSGLNSSAIFNDERKHAMEMQRIAKQKEEAALQLVAATMNTTKVKEMQHQKHLQTQMQMAFKMGDHETYRKIKEKLQPPDK